MALFTTYKAPPASGLLGSTWRTGDGGAAQTGGLGVQSNYNTYSAQYNSGLATSLNHFGSVKYTEYWTGTNGYPIRVPDASIPRLDKKNKGSRGHINDAEHKALVEHGDSLYYAKKSVNVNGSYAKILPSRPMYHAELWPRNYRYKRDTYHKDDSGNWSVTEDGSQRVVSIFRMVYTDSQGGGDEKDRNVFLAFGTNGSHGTIATGSSRLDNANGFVAGGETLNPLSNNHNTYVSNAGIVIIFREYVHYVGNPAGGEGLLDLTPFSITATAYVERNMKTDIYSPYGNPEIVDFGNIISPIKLWPTKHLTGLLAE